MEVRDSILGPEVSFLKFSVISLSLSQQVVELHLKYATEAPFTCVAIIRNNLSFDAVRSKHLKKSF
jgi:hypothetical protein